MKRSDPSQVILATGFLAGKQFITIDEVWGQHLVHCVQVPLDYSRLHEAAGPRHVLFCRRPNQLPPHHANPRSSSERLATTSMMPPGGVRRIDRRLIHPSAWNKNSANFALTEF